MTSYEQTTDDRVSTLAQSIQGIADDLNTLNESLTSKNEECSQLWSNLDSMSSQINSLNEFWNQSEANSDRSHSEVKDLLNEKVTEMTSEMRTIWDAIDQSEIMSRIDEVPEKEELDEIKSNIDTLVKELAESKVAENNKMA